MLLIPWMAKCLVCIAKFRSLRIELFPFFSRRRKRYITSTDICLLRNETCKIWWLQWGKPLNHTLRRRIHQLRRHLIAVLLWQQFYILFQPKAFNTWCVQRHEWRCELSKVSCVFAVNGQGSMGAGILHIPLLLSRTECLRSWKKDSNRKRIWLHATWKCQAAWQIKMETLLVLVLSVCRRLCCLLLAKSDINSACSVVRFPAGLWCIPVLNVRRARMGYQGNHGDWIHSASLRFECRNEWSEKDGLEANIPHYNVISFVCWIFKRS